MTLLNEWHLFTLSEYKQKELLAKGLLFENEEKSFYHIDPFILERTPEENGNSWQFAKFSEDSDIYNRFINESGNPF